MRTVVLYGELADKFIDKIDFEISTPVEALRALGANFKGFYEYIYGYKPGFVIKVGDLEQKEEDLNLPIKDSTEVHIIPVIAGSGKFGMIIAGIALIAMTGGFGSGAAGSWLAGSTSTGFATAVGKVGVGLVLSGISAVLFAPPKTPERGSQEDIANTYFSGVVNNTAQGVPVSIGYGELIIGSSVISAGITLDTPVSLTDGASWLYDGTAGQNGSNWHWHVYPTQVYNIVTHVFHTIATNEYTHSQTVNVTPEFWNVIKAIREEPPYDEYYYKLVYSGLAGGYNYREEVVKPPETKTLTYKYDHDTRLFTITSNLDYECLVPSILGGSTTNKSNVYCVWDDSEDKGMGSFVVPEGWAT